jgi:hypothetical protein
MKTKLLGLIPSVIHWRSRRGGFVWLAQEEESFVKKIPFSTTAAMAIGGVIAIATPSLATAATYQFDATSAAYGFLGDIQYDSSVFDGSASDAVSNTNILSLYFKDPISGNVITTVGTGTVIFDSTGPLPTVLTSSGYLAGTSAANGVGMAPDNTPGPFFVSIGTGTDNNLYYDVTWTAEVVTATPLPAALPLFAGGLGIIGFAAGLKKRKAAGPAAA